jgi:hypothetical protein
MAAEKYDNFPAGRYDNFPVVTRKMMDLPGSVQEVENMPEIKNQDDLGLCYGFTASSLLEHYMCKVNKRDCSKLQEKEKVSVLFTSAYTTEYEHLSEGGSAKRALTRLQKVTNNFVSEECAPFSQLLKKETFVQDGQTYESESHGNGWKAFEQLFMVRDDPAFLDKMRSEIPKLSIFDREVEALNVSFSIPNPDNMRNEILLPGHCKHSKWAVKYPAYLTAKYPKYDHGIWAPQTLTERDLEEKIKSLVDKEIPVGVNICMDEDETGGCESAHVFIVSGYKTVCDRTLKEVSLLDQAALVAEKKCEVLLKVHNSWGKQWQKKHRGGWIKGQALLTKARQYFEKLGLSQAPVLTWIESEAQK